MNTVLTILSMIPAIINAIKAIEEAIPMSGKGKEKADMVVAIITAAGDGAKELIPAIQKVISVVVATLNATGVFKKSE